MSAASYNLSELNLEEPKSPRTQVTLMHRNMTSEVFDVLDRTLKL